MSDPLLDGLSAYHHMVLRGFEAKGKTACATIRDHNGSRSVPFDTILRQMTVRFPKEEKELLRIDEINHEMVRLHGGSFIDVVVVAQTTLRSLEAKQE